MVWEGRNREVPPIPIAGILPGPHSGTQDRQTKMRQPYVMEGTALQPIVITGTRPMMME